MKRQKLYFADSIGEDCCHRLEYFIEEIREQQLLSLKVYLAIRETGTDYFFCKKFNFDGYKSGSDCGKWCEKYKPRNSKSGCCVHLGYCYDRGQAFILTLDGKLEPC